MESRIANRSDMEASKDVLELASHGAFLVQKNSTARSNVYQKKLDALRACLVGGMDNLPSKKWCLRVT